MIKSQSTVRWCLSEVLTIASGADLLAASDDAGLIGSEEAAPSTLGLAVVAGGAGGCEVDRGAGGGVVG